MRRLVFYRIHILFSLKCTAWFFIEMVEIHILFFLKCAAWVFFIEMFEIHILFFQKCAPSPKNRGIRQRHAAFLELGICFLFFETYFTLDYFCLG